MECIISTSINVGIFTDELFTAYINFIVSKNVMTIANTQTNIKDRFYENETIYNIA